MEKTHSCHSNQPYHARQQSTESRLYSVTTKREANANLINPMGELQYVLY